MRSLMESPKSSRKGLLQVDIDEDFIRIKTLSDKVAETVLDAYHSRFRRFDQYEKTIIFNSLIKIITTFLMNLPIQDRVVAIQTLLSVVEQLMSPDNQNEKF